MPAHQIVTIPLTFFLSVQMTAGAAEYTIRKILLNFTLKQKICFLIHTPRPQSLLNKQRNQRWFRERIVIPPDTHWEKLLNPSVNGIFFKSANFCVT